MAREKVDFKQMLKKYKKKYYKVVDQLAPPFFRSDRRLENKNFGLIIEGSVLEELLSLENSQIFWKIVSECNSVICCRCSPIQKSQIVEFVKNKSGQLTLSVGDGGNDVNMIKAAHVGVGLMGKEGNQAASSADYSLTSFEQLKRLIFYVGRLSLVRNSYFLKSYFFKNMVFSVPQIWLSIHTGFSGSQLYDQLYFIMFNSFLSALPASYIITADEDIDIDFKSVNLVDKKSYLCLVPEIYAVTRNKKNFTYRIFLLIMVLGSLNSLVLFYMPYFCFENSIIDLEGRVAF